MNKSILMGRPTRRPEVRISQGVNAIAIARLTLAVPRKYKANGEEEADFISCVAFGKQAEFLEKYVQQGTKIIIIGHIQTGSYTNKEGKKVYTTDVVIDEIEFAESKSASQQRPGATSTPGDGYMTIPDEVNEELPFN